MLWSMSEREIFLKELGAQLREARKHEGLKQVELGERIGVSQQVIADYESGTRHLQVRRLVQICDVLGVEIADVVGRGETGPRKRGPTPLIQKQLEAITELPKDKRAFITEVLTKYLKHAV